MALGDAPVLETVLEMTAASIEHAELDPASQVLVRPAAPAVVDAPVASYLMHVGPAAESGLTLNTVQDVLVAVAPVIGSARTVAETAKIVEARGFAIALTDEDEDAESAGTGR
jgi:hypothetical protein